MNERMLESLSFLLSFWRLLHQLYILPLTHLAPHTLRHKPTFPPQHPFRHPPPHPNQPTNKRKNNDRRNQQPNNSTSHEPLTACRIEERVDVVAPDRVADVCEAEVEGEDDDESDEVDPGVWIGARDEDLEGGEDGVEGVFGDVAPDCEGGVEGAVGEEGPEDDWWREC